jgi:DNA polymerase I
MVIETLAEVEAMVDDLISAPNICFDTETTGLRVIDDQVVALQFCGDNDSAYFISTGMMDSRFRNLPMHEVARLCRPLWDKGLLGHNLGFDWKMMQKYGVDFEIFADTYIMAKLYNVYDSAALKDLVKAHLGLDEVISFKSLFPAKVKKAQRRFDVVEFDRAVPYACQDVIAGLRLYHHLGGFIDSSHFIYQLELATIKPLARMELLGVRLDQEQIAAATSEAERIMAEQVAFIDAAAGRPVHLTKPRDIARLLYDELKLPVLKRSEKTQAASTDAATLKNLAGSHAVVDAILQYREAEKIKVGFLDPLPGFVQKDGCIHTQYNQYGAVSGRLSCKEPNMQQVPKERGKSNDALRNAVRASILPPPGFIGFLDIDYSQIEYRLFASLSQDPGLMEAFHRGIDVHQQTAAIMTGTPVAEVDKNLRQKGKAINFMAIYGGSKFKLAEMIGCTVEEADEMLKDYWKKLPAAAKYCGGVKARSRSVGYCETYFGRRRPLPKINSNSWKERGSAEREAVNTSVQGTAADIIKMAIVRADKILTEQGFKSRLVLNVHDQLTVAHHPDDSLDDVASAMQWAMEVSMPGWCDLVTDPGYGPDWKNIEDFVYPNRRKSGEEAPSIQMAPTESILTASPPLSDTDALTLRLSEDVGRDLLERVAHAMGARPGATTLFLDAAGKRLRARQGVAVDRELLMQLRVEGVVYAISPALERRLLKAS